MGQAPVPVRDQYSDEQKQHITTLYHQGKTQDEIAQYLGCPRRTAGKLCKALGLTRDHHQAAKLAVTSDDPDLVARIRELRPTHSIPELVRLLDIKQSTLQRMCERNHILPPENYPQLQSQRMLAAWTTEKRQAMSDRSKALVTPELRQMLAQSTRDCWSNPEYRANQIATQTEYWNIPENRERLAQYRAVQSGRLSNIQRMLYDMLDDLGAEYTPEFVLGPYNFDCLVHRPNRTDLLIECQGDYWHSLEKAIRMDKAKATYIGNYCEHSHSLHYLWEHEFHCKDRVLETLKYWLGKTEVELAQFDFSQLQLRQATAADYRPLLQKYHYLPNAGRGGIAQGAYFGDELVAVCVFSPPVRQNVDTGRFQYSEVTELSRLCIHPRYQRPNLGSWFVSKCIRSLDKRYKCVLSYCDTTFNHNGAIYRSLNFKQDRVIRPDYWYTDDRGWVMHKKTLYQRAVQLSVTEAEYAEQFGYKRVYGSEKLRFVFER